MTEDEEGRNGLFQSLQLVRFPDESQLVSMWHDHLSVAVMWHGYPFVMIGKHAEPVASHSHNLYVMWHGTFAMSFLA